MDKLTDNAIMMKVKAGDLDKMGLLFERYHYQLYRFLYHMTYQREASEDMVQQVFYKMLKYRNSFAGNGEFIHWMYTIARNVIKDQGKRKKLAIVVAGVEELSDLLPGGSNVEEILEKKQAAAELHQAMGRLNEDEREILTLSRFQELKHHEVAAILNISEGAVKVRVHRALNELKHIYKKLNVKQRNVMKCEPYEELFTGWINKDLTPAQHELLEQHLSICKGCQEELAATKQIWADMGAIPTPPPSAHMRVRFEVMLDAYKESAVKKDTLWNYIIDSLAELWQWQPRLPLAYSLVVVAVSFACGYWVFNTAKGGHQDEQLQALSSQVHELKQTMTLALMENPSASERIKGVSYTTQIKHADQQVIEALLETLNTDPNVNVRLSTLDALTHFSSYPQVREGLILSITQQESPLMQSAIADVMLKLQEKRAVGSFKELLKQKNLDNGVRNKIKQTISSLI